MVTCVDQHDVDLVKADGTSSGKDMQHRYSVRAVRAEVSAQGSIPWDRVKADLGLI